MNNTHTIATGHSETSQAAATILDRGGNAYDAILAALMMSFVAEPLMSSPGGGGYLLACPAGGKPKILDFFSQTPYDKDVDKKDFYPIYGDFGATQQEFHIGMAAAATPGVPAGIFAIHQQYASMPLLDIAQAAIEKANSGIVVNQQYAQVVKILKPILNYSSQAAAIYTNEKGRFVEPGDVNKNPQLAEFLHQLATHDDTWFYHENPAKNIVADMENAHGLLREKDFTSYQVMVRDALKFALDDWCIYTNAKPTSGGLLITEQLKHAKNNPSDVLNHKLIEAMVHADQLKKQQDFHSSRGTTHMSVIDAKGNVASMTVSNGEGCGYIVPDSGFMLNNFLGEEDINAGGFFNFETNSRMMSMMSPTILINGEDKFALGSGGSNRIKTALFQVIWQLISERKTLGQAIDAPRIHYENGVLDLEKGTNQNNIHSLLEACDKVNEWDHRSLYFGGVNAVQYGPTCSAVADSRRNGMGMIVKAK